MHNLLLVLQREVVDALQHADKLCELSGRVFLPALLGRFLVVLSRSLEEERAERPQFLDEADAVLHHTADLRHTL